MPQTPPGWTSNPSPQPGGYFYAAPDGLFVGMDGSTYLVSRRERAVTLGDLVRVRRDFATGNVLVEVPGEMREAPGSLKDHEVRLSPPSLGQALGVCVAPVPMTPNAIRDAWQSLKTGYIALWESGKRLRDFKPGMTQQQIEETQVYNNAVLAEMTFRGKKLVDGVSSLPTAILTQIVYDILKAAQDRLTWQATVQLILGHIADIEPGLREELTWGAIGRWVTSLLPEEAPGYYDNMPSIRLTGSGGGFA